MKKEQTLKKLTQKALETANNEELLVTTTQNLPEKDKESTTSSAFIKRKINETAH